MKIDFKGLMEGMYNKHLGAQWKKEVAENRYLNHCKVCVYNSTNAKKEGYQTLRLDEFCTVCLCNLDYKTHCMDCNCPKEYWKQVLSEEEAEKVDKIIEDDSEESEH